MCPQKLLLHNSTILTRAGVHSIVFTKALPDYNQFTGSGNTITSSN